MNKHKSSKIKENSNTVRHLIMGQIITTQNLVAIKVVRHAGQQVKISRKVTLQRGHVSAIKQQAIVLFVKHPVHAIKKAY